jgi:hypothetical protein
MPKKKLRIGQRRAVGEPQQVTPLRRALTDANEILLLKKGHLIFPERGDITLLKVLGQAYDEANVVALDLLLGDQELTGIRKLDKDLERRLQLMLKRTALRTDNPKTWAVRLRLVAVIG